MLNRLVGMLGRRSYGMSKIEASLLVQLADLHAGAGIPRFSTRPGGIGWGNGIADGT